MTVPQDREDSRGEKYVCKTGEELMELGNVEDEMSCILWPRLGS